MTKYRKLKSMKFLYEISKEGELRNVKSKKIIKGYKKPNDYHRVTVSNKSLIKDGKRGNVKTYLMHRLIAEAWIPIPKKYLDQGLTIDDLTVNHKNHDRLNNNISNLEWVTFAENIQYTFNHPNHPGMREGLDKARKASMRPIRAENVYTGEKIDFDSIVDGIQYVKDKGYCTGTCKSSIEKVLYGKRKVAYKHKWSYL